MLLPVLASALVAGLAGAAAAYVIRLVLDLDATTGVLVAVPVALGIALLAAVGPAVAASRTSPVDAMRAPARRTSRRRVAPGALGLRHRVELGVAGTWADRGGLVGVATATAAVGSLLAVQAEFRGRAAGTLLGDAVAVPGPHAGPGGRAAHDAARRLRGAPRDGDRDQGTPAELATLRAVGWADRTVARLLLTQAAYVAALGAVVGGLASWWFLGAVFEVRTTAMLLALLGAGALAVVVAVLVTLLPVGRLRTASVGRLLSED